jgi:hypothetical protein
MLLMHLSMLRRMLALILITVLHNEHVDASIQSIPPRTSTISAKKCIPKADVLMIPKLSSNVMKQVDDEDILCAPRTNHKAHPVKLVQFHASFAKRCKPLSTESGESDVSNVNKDCEEWSECTIIECSFEHERGEECVLLYVKHVERGLMRKERMMIDVASIEQVMMVIDQGGWIKRMHCKESSFSAMMEVS